MFEVKCEVGREVGEMSGEVRAMLLVVGVLAGMAMWSLLAAFG